ncbi:expressed unknown protein [Seminavis robusta]|uniref:GOLD domain-containing protein n=1 Tax=Seminavis robusta TaxID=568900 RepID=A0A9N8HN78_9STRA|nr:expressed unknown protein [Seminavis robusta]|eukprot:Sro800_g204300.1 n/a (267) ;mRNA; f:21288-22316
MVYTLLKGTGSNCVSVDTLPGSTLEIEYHLPDLKVKDNVEDQKLLDEPLNTEGMDEAEAALLQRQREVAIKRARQGKDVSIAISQRNPFPIIELEPHKRERPRNQREQPADKEGTILFETSPTGGPVQLCIHSLFANKLHPYLIGLRIEQIVNLSAEQTEMIHDEQEQGEAPRILVKNDAADAETEQVLSHLSAFTQEMVRAENLVRTILASADVVKKEEADFYEQSIRMEKSVHFWPMVQLVCLLLAAFFQIRHVVTWMKRKHIY